MTYLSIYPPCCNSLILLLFQSSSLGFKSMLFIIQATLWPAGLQPSDLWRNQSKTWFFKFFGSSLKPLGMVLVLGFGSQAPNSLFSDKHSFPSYWKVRKWIYAGSKVYSSLLIKKRSFFPWRRDNLIGAGSLLPWIKFKYSRIVSIYFKRGFSCVL